MKITIYAIGKLKEPYLREGVEEFLKRLKPYAQVKIIELPEEKAKEKIGEAERQQIVWQEGQRLLKQIKEKEWLVLLDLHGKRCSSEELAGKVAECALQGKSDLAFVIGGAFGISDELRDRADFLLSFGAMTFTHQMIRLLLVEQIYRSFKINRKEPYHW